MKKFVLILFFLLSSQIVFGQKCGSNFDEIKQSCIESFDSKMNTAPAGGKKNEHLIEIKANNDQLVGQTYFYRTSKGNLGKFQVIAAESTDDSCSLFINAVTFIKGESFVPPTGISIKNQYNMWIPNKVSLGKDPAVDFQLSRVFENSDGVSYEGNKKPGSIKNYKNKCVLDVVDAKVVKYGNTKDNSLSSGRELLFYAAHFLIGLAVFLIARVVFVDEERYKVSERLEDAEDSSSKKESNDIVLKYSRPFFKRYFSPIVKGMKNKKKIRDKYKRSLASAGLAQELDPEDFFAFKLFLIIGFPIIFLGLRQFLEEDWPVILVPIVSLVGFYYPDIWIKGKIEQRRENITRSMPFIVDMLALSVEAGLDFVAAMQKVIEKAPPSALADEFETMIKETKVGSSRAEALRNMSWRINSLSISSFCATLIAADSVGANIAPILKTLAGELRQKRSADAEKKGAMAATKILFPTIFIIMPAVMLIVMGPVFLQMMVGG